MRHVNCSQRVKTLFFITSIAALSLTSGCDKTVEWKEEVKLNDGRIIAVTQRKRCERGDYRANKDATCIARESWLTVRLPEFSDGDIVWHENLKPMVINVDEGQLYVVGLPPTSLEFRNYGAHNPPYLGFRWNKRDWIRINFTQIPKSIYETNMLIENIPRNRTSFLRLAAKDSELENGNPVYPAYFRRIDPTFKISIN